MRIGLFGLVLISIGKVYCQPIDCKYFKIQIWRTFTLKDIPHKSVVKRGSFVGKLLIICIQNFLNFAEC